MNTPAVDLGSNLDEDAPGLAPITKPLDLQEQVNLMQQQLAALTTLLASTVQQQSGLKFKGINDSMPIPPPPVAPADEKRVRIMLEDNETIPPGGQFIQANGVPFMLQSGVEVDVPVSLLDVLDHAIQSVPVCDENRNIIGYRDRLRLPYRVIRHTERDQEEPAMAV